MNRQKIFLAAMLAVAILILIVLGTHLDLHAIQIQLRRVGFVGATVILLDLMLALLGPLLSWHLLMRGDGIQIPLRTTLLSGLMGRAVNLISPMMYFGGEGVRTFYIARVTGLPQRRILATIVAGEFQTLAALTAGIVAAAMVAAGSSRAHALPVAWMIGGAVGLALVVVLLFLILALGFNLVPRLLGFLMRLGILTVPLASLKSAAADVEVAARSLMTQNKRRFFVAQLLAFTTPVGHFILPAIFFGFLKSADAAVVQPTFSQLASAFVLIELLFAIPTTPAGLGVYEASIIGVFKLHGWSTSDAAAYAILFRLDDVLFSISGAILLAHMGLTGFLKGSADA